MTEKDEGCHSGRGLVLQEGPMEAPAAGARFGCADAFQWPHLQAGQRILCLGIGGSLDVVAAASVADELSAAYTDATVLFGVVDLHTNLEGWEATGHGCMHRRPAEMPAGLSAAQRSRAEWQLLPGPEGSPLLFRLPQLWGRSPEDLIVANEKAIVPGLLSLSLDAILAVDVGGDSVTAGGRNDARTGQDWHVLNAVLKSAIPSQLIVLGFGVDGESTSDELEAALARAHADGAFRGRNTIGGLILDGLRRVGMHLRLTNPSACPNIVVAAIDGTLREKRGQVIVPRNLRPRIPRTWATGLFAFDTC